MDGLPIVEHLERLNEAFVRSWWHWWFLAQALIEFLATPTRRRSTP